MVHARTRPVRWGSPVRHDDHLGCDDEGREFWLSGGSVYHSGDEGARRVCPFVAFNRLSVRQNAREAVA